MAVQLFNSKNKGQARRTLRKWFIFFMFSCCLVFSSSCGLEEVIVISEPTVTNHYPSYSSDDYTTYYCDFLTNEIGQADSFLGTEVYYKIYNNSSTLVSERSSILSLNSTSNGNAAATRMVESYTYQALGSNPQSSDSIFVPTTGANRRVYFRIVDNGDGDELKADIRISGTSTGRIPYRYSNDKSFDFFDNDDSDSSDKVDVEPVSGDLDYKNSSSSSVAGEYYVQFFAVGVAWDSSALTRSYSLVLDLGSIPVIKDN